jgi:hypothetical protein
MLVDGAKGVLVSVVLAGTAAAIVVFRRWSIAKTEKIEPEQA